MDLKKIIKEVLENHNDTNCDCFNDIKPPIINENLQSRITMTENMKRHIDGKIPLTQNVFRYGSPAFLDLWAEARYLYSRNVINLSGPDEHIIQEMNLGEYGTIYEIEIGDKVKASKEYGNLSGEVVDIRGSFIVVKTKEGNQSYHESDLKVLNKEGKKVPLDLIMEEGFEQINESEYHGKKVDLNKPRRGGSSGKKYYVYVKDPRTKKVKKVSFGDAGGLKAKINDPKARQAFSKRHNCPEKNDKTKASYWSCRLPSYAKALGLKSTFTGFW